MTTIAEIARRSLRCVPLLVPALLLSAPLPAQDLTAHIEAASRAAEAASEAADAAAEAARAAAEAARDAAAASNRALQAAHAAAGSAPTASTEVAAAGAAGAPPYEGHVRCEGASCQVDLWMIRGFRAFSQCQVCHGLEGAGSTIAPSLLDKLKEIDKARFLQVVREGYTGQIGVMPGWEENPNVMNYVEQLYAYLKARSDGVLPPGRLKRYDR